jgi:hypothetical protein
MTMSQLKQEHARQNGGSADSMRFYVREVECDDDAAVSELPAGAGELVTVV